MLRFKCNNCHKLFEADISLAGKVITCPDCRIWMFVPNPRIDQNAVGGQLALPQADREYSEAHDGREYSEAHQSGEYSEAHESGEYSEAHDGGEYLEAHQSGDFSEAHQSGDFSEAHQGGEFPRARSSAVKVGAAANVPMAATILQQSELKQAGLLPSPKKRIKRGLTQRVIILLGLGCLTFMACFLPWVHIDNQGIEIETAGYHSVFTPPAATHYGVKVDLARAVLPMALVLCATVAAAYLTRERVSGQESEPSDEERESMITRLQLCNPALPPKRQDAETWPN